jgi:capsular exopolysaccharide synthesis family protein
MSMDLPPMDAPPQRGAGDNQFRFVLNVLTEHWKMLVLGVLAGMMLLGAVSLLRMETQTTLFTASASVDVIPSQSETVGLSGMAGFLSSPNASQLCARTSKRDLAEEVAHQLVQKDIGRRGPFSRYATPSERKTLADLIEGRLALDPYDSLRQVHIVVSNCPTEEEAIDIAEFAARNFLIRNQQLDLELGRDRHAYIAQELEQMRQQVKEAENKEWDYKQKMGFRSTGSAVDNMTQMETELEKLSATGKETVAKLEELDAALEENLRQLPESLDQVSESSIDMLFAKLDKLHEENLILSAEYQPTADQMEWIGIEIEDQQTAIKEALARLNSGGAGGSSVWRKRQEIYQQRLLLSTQLATGEVRMASLRRRLEDLIPKLPELANENRAFRELEQETERYRKSFQLLHDKEWNFRVALRRGGSRVERNAPVTSAPVTSGMTPRASLNMSMFMGGLLGFICAFAFAMALEVNDTSIRNIEDVNQYIGLEVLGTIPKMRFGRPRGGRRRRATYVTTVDEEQVDACIVTQHDPKSPISEAYRTLRTNYQFTVLQQKPKSLMVTSAVPGEGKTTTGVNLAVTMADRGIRVLIVDTDLRRPNVHRVLRMERGPGLADVLREGLDLRSVIRSTRVENLWIISSGRVPPNPSELIGSESMSHVIKELSADFDLIICDAPSVLVVTDPVLLATHVDTCLMVVSTNNARRETVIRAKKLLETAKVNVVGVVVNGLETTRRHYYYYYYYYDDGAPVRRKWYHFY